MCVRERETERDVKRGKQVGKNGEVLKEARGWKE